MAASESTLGALHEMLAAKMIEQLKVPEHVTPALLAAVAKFLKDNGIEANSDSPQMKKLREKVGDVLKFPFDPSKQQSVA